MSWVIREKASGRVLFETFDARKVKALNTAKYEAVPIGTYLGEINRKIRDQPTPGQYDSATQFRQYRASPLRDLPNYWGVVESEADVVLCENCSQEEAEMIASACNAHSRLVAALENVLGFCATNQGMEAQMAIEDARAALASVSP